MKSAEKLKNSMQPGKVYRREDLKKISTALDRDLKTLIKSGAVRKLAWGLYDRPQNISKDAGYPHGRELIRAFLKTDDFRLYDNGLVHNHKRAGTFMLAARRFEFRIIRQYPALVSGGPSVVRDLPVRILTKKEAEYSDLEFWLTKSAHERISAVEFLREQFYALSGFKSLPRLAHSIQLRPRQA